MGIVLEEIINREVNISTSKDIVYIEVFKIT